MSDEEFKCECLECGHKFTSKDHCVDTKCPECGGKTRRAERPGAGKENRSDDMAENSCDGGECVETAETTNSPPWGDIKKNKANFPKKTQFIIRSGDDWSDWKLPYKLKSGKIHCGGVAAASQAAGGARQKKPMSLTSTERARLNAARKACKIGESKTSDEMVITMSMGKLVDVEMVEETDEYNTYKYELMDNAKTYNGLHFPGDAIRHQNEKFQEHAFKVTHGKDHSHAVSDMLGEVIDMKLIEEDNDVVRCFITSKFYKETDAQKEAQVLMKQGLLNYISGGWSARIVFNEEEGRFEISKPILREVSSTPVPAKTDAKIQNVFASLMVIQDSTNVNTEEQEIENIPMEELDMPENETPEPEVQPSPEPEGAEEQSADYVALKEKVDAIEAKEELQTRASLLKRAAEIGLSADDFTDVSNEIIEKSLEVANKAIVSALRENRPDIPIGGEGDQAFEDGSPEMLEFLAKNVYMTDLMED